MTDEGGAERDFDVAVSFAGEDREFAEDLAERLKTSGLRVFIDSDFEAEMWGEDLVEYFDQVYRTRSRFAIVLVSRHYAAKMWTMHERRSALARGLEQTTPYVLPVRLDDVDLKGLRPTVGYLDARRLGLDGIAAAAIRKSSGPSTHSGSITEVPRTEVEQQRLLALLPPGWEYLYWASELLRRRDALESAYLDHEIGIASPAGVLLHAQAAIARLQSAPSEIQRLLADYNRLMEPVVQERAFGAPGQVGDRDRIRHLAERMNDFYEGLLNWSAALRSAQVPDEFKPTFEALAHYADQPIESYRTFVDDIVSSLEKALQGPVPGKTHHLALCLNVSIPEETMDSFNIELAKLKKAIE